MLRRTLTAPMFVITIGTSLSLLACKQDDAPLRDSVVAVTPPAHDFAAILASAKSSDYTYEDPARIAVSARDPTDITHPGVPEASAPTMTIAKAIRASTPTPLTEEVLAKIVSDRAYPDLGLRPGDNYVWRYRADPVAANWQVWVVSDNPSHMGKQLSRSAHDFTDGNHTQPRIVRARRTTAAAVVAFGACLEDPVCPSGHCGYQ